MKKIGIDKFMTDRNDEAIEWMRRSRLERLEKGLCGQCGLRSRSYSRKFGRYLTRRDVCRHENRLARK